MALKEEKPKTIDSVFAVLVILLPFLHQYKGIGRIISFGEVILFPFIVFFMIRAIMNFRLKNVNKPLLLFYGMSLMLTALNCLNNYFSFTAAGTIIARMIYYMFLVYVARTHFHYSTIAKVYNGLVLLASLYLLLQFAVYHSSGKILPIFLKYEWQFPPDARPLDFYRLGYRPSSLFLEASYYTLFVLPSICINLFSGRRTKLELFALCSACLGIVLSTSAAGVLGVGLLFVIFMLRDPWRKSPRRILIDLIIFFAAVGGIMYILYAPNSLLLRSRISSGGSIGQRVLRGFIVFGKLPESHKLFGVGIGNMESYMIYYHISTVYDESLLNNCASIVQTLVYFGLVGLASLVVFLLAEIKRSKGRIGFPFVIMLIYIMSYENILFYFRFAFLFIILEAINREELSPCKELPTQICSIRPGEAK